MAVTQISGQLGSARLGLFNLGSGGPKTVQQARIDSYTASTLGPVVPGAAVTLTWVTQFSTTTTISGVGTVAGSGNTTVNPTVTTTYTLTASDGVHPNQSQLLTIVVTTPAVFVNSCATQPFDPGPIPPWLVSCNLQLTLGNLVVVIAYSNTSDSTQDLVLTQGIGNTDSLGNVYIRRIRGGPVSYNPPPTDPGAAGGMAIFSTIVTSPGTATITVASSSRNLLQLGVLQYSIPAGMDFSQGAHLSGQNLFTSPGPYVYGTEPVNLANSLVITAIADGYGLLWTSLDGDTSRIQFPGVAVTGQGALGGAIFDTVLAGPGIRNCNVSGFPINQMTIPFGASNPNMLAVAFSAPLPRPVGLPSQSAVMPSLGSTPAGYAGQPTATMALPYMPLVGDVIFVGASALWGFAPAPIPQFSASDTYGNAYQQVPQPGGAWQGGVGGTPPTQDAAAMFYSVVKFLPTSGLFLINVAMTPVNGPGVVGAAAYSVSGFDPTKLQSAILVAKTTEGSNSRMATGTITVAAQSLFWGFTGVQQQAGNNVPTPFIPTDGYSVDTQWTIANVYLSPLTNYPKWATGAVIHKVVTLPGTYDAQSLTTGFQQGDITVVSTPSGGMLTLACPVGGGSAQVGVAYSATLVATGGTLPYTFSIISGLLPPGLILNAASGVISGIPTLPGTYSYTAQVKDANGLISQVSAPCQITVTQNSPPTCIVNPVPLSPTLLILNEPVENQGS